MLNCTTEEEWVRLARENEPSGRICGFCGKDNDFADDYGWFWISPRGDRVSAPCCRDCYEGEPGRFHIKRYGVGER